jgi:predicted RNase H-like HicB family nuclease
LRYTIVLIPEPDSHGVNVRVPAMPTVFTWGATKEEAIASAREAVSLHLEQYVERGKRFPRDRGSHDVPRLDRYPPPRLEKIEVQAPTRQVTPWPL